MQSAAYKAARLSSKQMRDFVQSDQSLYNKKQFKVSFEDLASQRNGRS